LAEATDEKSQKRLTLIVNSIESRIPEDAAHYQELGRQIAAFQSNIGYDVAGTLVEKQDDGTFKNWGRLLYPLRAKHISSTTFRNGEGIQQWWAPPYDI